jgi:sulfonate transport system substrate-binding protein
MTISRRAAILGVAAVGATAATGQAFAGTNVRFSYQRSSTLLSLLKADGTLEKRFAEKGFGVSWHLFDNVISPMTAGAVDVHADVADAVPIFTQSARAPLTFYAREIGSPSAEAIVVLADSPIRTIQDLKGKSVAVNRGSGSHFILAAALKCAGLSFADIKPAYLAPSDSVAAFERRSVDALAIWDPFLAILESKIPTRTLADATGLSHYHRYYSANASFVDAHPDLVAIVFDALVDTGRWVRANPKEAAVKLAPLWGGVPLPVVETVEHRRTYDVQPIDRQALGDQQAIADTFLGAGLIPAHIDATDIAIWRPRDTRT